MQLTRQGQAAQCLWFRVGGELSVQQRERVQSVPGRDLVEKLRHSGQGASSSPAGISSGVSGDAVPMGAAGSD